VSLPFDFNDDGRTLSSIATEVGTGEGDNVVAVALLLSIGTTLVFDVSAAILFAADCVVTKFDSCCSTLAIRK
jgi:hypothetical protein